MHGDATDVSAWCTVHAARSSSAVSVVYVNTDGGRVATALAEDGRGRGRGQGCGDKTRLAKASAGLHAPRSTTSPAVSRTPISPRSLGHRCWQTTPVPIKPVFRVDSKISYLTASRTYRCSRRRLAATRDPQAEADRAGLAPIHSSCTIAVNAPYTLHIVSYRGELCLEHVSCKRCSPLASYSTAMDL